MNTPVVIAAAAMGAAVAMGSVFVLRMTGPGGRPAQGEDGEKAGVEVAEMKRAVARLTTEVKALQAVVAAEAEADAGAGNAEAGGASALGPRLEALEESVARLQSSFDGAISLEAASAERTGQFLAEDGYEKADEYFEAGKYSIAADGYLKFVHAHPEHPDARNILERARQAYHRAGYEDLSIWVQEEMMKSFPESRVADLKTLATMEKEAGRYDAAIEHIAEAATLTPDTQEKMWNRMYWAWYHQLRDGPEAGLAAYEQVQQEIQSAGLGDHKSATKIQEKIDELRKQVASGNGGQ